MAQLTNIVIVPSGLTPTYVAANVGGDTIVDDGQQRTFLKVKNGGGGSINVTIAKNISSKTVPGVGALTIADKVIAVAAGAEAMIGPFTDAYRAPGGIVSIAYSGVTTVTVAAVRLTPAA